MWGSLWHENGVLMKNVKGVVTMILLQVFVGMEVERGSSTWIRTRNPRINSAMLYR